MSYDQFSLASEKVNRIQTYMPKHDYQFRLCLIGDSYVGKTSLLNKYFDRTFKEDYINTIGCDFKVVTLEVDSKIVKMQLWDTAGQERFKSISINYFRSAHSLMFVFDLSKKESLENLSGWIELAFSNNKTTIANILVGNKKDLLRERQVSEEEALAFAKKYNMVYVETSAKEEPVIDYVFDYLAYKITREYIKHQPLGNSGNNNNSDGEINLDNGNSLIITKKKGCNC